MNDKKICFIVCVNNDMYIDECVYYIRNLEIPSEYEIDIITVQDAGSMTSGYNAAMQESDAKYKIYIHQDVFLTKRDMIYDILRIFKDSSIGMIGLIGTQKLPDDGCMWHGKRVGRIYTNNILSSKEFIASEYNEKPYMQVEAVDGLFMATQYDITWREDLFTGWDFYDVSQSQEFLKDGYKIVVPYMDKPWCIHDEGFLNLDRYEEFRKIFLEEYMGGNNH